MIALVVSFSACSISDDQVIQAAKEGNVSSIKTYLQAKPEGIHLKNQLGYSLLHIAVMSKNPQTVQFLIDSGADMEEKDPSGQTALLLAANVGAEQAVRTLIEGGADIRVRNERNKNETALHVAARSGSVEIARLLVEKGLEVDSMDSQKITPLNWASFVGTLDMVKYFVSVGGRLDALDNYGDTPLTSAATRKDDPDRKILAYLKTVVAERAAASVK